MTQEENNEKDAKGYCQGTKARGCKLCLNPPKQRQQIAMSCAGEPYLERSGDESLCSSAVSEPIKYK